MVNNLEIKKELIASGKYDEFRAQKRYLNKYKTDTQLIEEVNKTFEIGRWQFLLDMEDLFKHQEHFKELNQINDARKKRVHRMYEYIEELLKMGLCGFITLTFRDDVLQSTTEETRRRYVTRYLKQEFRGYVANIDYGDKNGREHYHAVVLLNEKYKTEEPQPWKCGFSLNKIINNKNSKALANYVGKLKSHSLKKSGCRFIYSANLKKLVESQKQAKKEGITTNE